MLKKTVFSSYLSKRVQRLISVFLLLISTWVHAQQIKIEGQIIAPKTTEIEGINIQNISTKRGVITDEDGYFEITVSKGDTLVLSAVHIVQTVVEINEKQISDRKIIVHLDENRHELNTVTIRRPLTGYLLSDSKIIPSKEIITATSVGLPNPDIPPLTKAESLLSSATSGFLDPIINGITGETKRLKNRIKLERKTNLTHELLKKFPETYFIDALKIERFLIYSFLHFCEDDVKYETTLKKSTLDIIEFLEIKSEEFRKKTHTE